MARLIPDWHTLRLLNAGQYRERDILSLLADGLPPDWTVLHSVNWSTTYPDDGGTQHFGEIDAVVLAPWGHLVLIEVKAGALGHTPEGLVKQYGNEFKSLDIQARVQHAAIRHSLNREGFKQVRVGQLLVLPDQRVEAGTAAHPRERIVDSQDLHELCSRLFVAMPANQGVALDTDRLLSFLLNRFELVMDVATQVQQVVQAQRRLAQGLATWVPRITSPSNAFVIEATAGSGKTQLALTLIAQAIRNGGRVAYVCFNRPLADHITTLVSPQAEVCTVHEWALHCARQSGWEPDFSQSGVFELITRQWLDVAEAQSDCLDMLIIDESQDFEAAWVSTLALRLNDNGHLYLMGDSDQALYPREPFDVSDAVHIRCQENFRSPRRIVATLNGLRLGSEPVQATSVFEGEYPEFVYCRSGADGTVAPTEEVLHRLWAEGYTPDQVVLLSWHKAVDSAVLQRDQLAGQPVRRWLGRFDAAANPVFSSGKLRAETVSRFKGQSAPVIVLVGLDFSELTEPLRRRLFVAMTRAQLKLICVLTAQAELALAAALEVD